MEEIKLTNAYLVTEQGITKKDIVICDGLINLTKTKGHCEQTIDLNGKYILPGFVDIHFHGYNLFDFTMGKFSAKTNSFDNSETAYKAGFEMLKNTLPRFGVTSFYIATSAGSLDNLKKCYGCLAGFLQRQQDFSGARLFGGLLEGCFINPQMCGAQNEQYLFESSRTTFDKIKDNNSIKLVNVVPDFGKDSVELTKYLTEKGIIVGAGHTNATCDQFYDAVNAGLKYCIHFTNGPMGNSFKPFQGGGAIEAVLKCDKLYAELIADGYHVSPAYIRDIIKRKGIDKIIGVTDCIYAAGTSLENVNISGITGQVSTNKEYIEVKDKKNQLYGSNLTMDRGFENMLNWLSAEMNGIWCSKHNALNFEEALAAASKIYSGNPCALTGLKTDGFGQIADEAKADLCVLDISGSAGNYKTTVESTIVGGDIVYSKNQKGL
ncbi:MAG: hypothetical protein ACYSSI_14070 [Planctomycetota bacterium]|jgi:N-acetylglucosamine-6-phosphate deacetylase